MHNINGIFGAIMNRLLKFLLSTACTTLAVATPNLAQAGVLTMTADGTALGFSLTTFATLNPSLVNTGSYGPFGVGMDTTGGSATVLVSNYQNNTRYTFNDVDGQTVATSLTSLPSSSYTSAYATAGGVTYGGDGSGRFVQFNKDGTVNHALTGVTTNPYLGMWGNPVNGHIIATSSAGLIDIDPLANGGLGSFRVITPSAFGDGVSVSPDGTKAYLAVGATVRVYDIATGVLLTSFSNALLNGLDGTGVISSSNSLNGDIVAVTNFGTVVLIDPNGFNDLGTAEFKLIANGGSRGDYTSPDVTNGTLFIDMSDAVYRLSCGSGCGIGTQQPNDSSVPEPGTAALVGLGLMGILSRRKFKPKSL